VAEVNRACQAFHFCHGIYTTNQAETIKTLKASAPRTIDCAGTAAGNQSQNKIPKHLIKTYVKFVTQTALDNCFKLLNQLYT